MKIEVRIIEAKDLKVTDYFAGTSDPYIKLSINGQMHKTNVVYRTCDPKFNQSFTFDIIPGQQITFEVFSFDESGRHDPLGTVQHSLSYFYQGQVSDLWLQLSKKGQIHIQVFSPGGLPNVLSAEQLNSLHLGINQKQMTTQSPLIGYKYFGYTPSFNELM
ncbi:C2 domain containing protein kinase C region 2 (CalB), putative [Entamoeba nuttalli P19]|uniref:C2 domain containing protein kinase C region 2 (CalB), putative n=1 Tax=Entamoeba nuttalli (strain P19) TaxID=1076696 RepID=K2H0K3_ENTNP|nr:C2 domain containing protein kinase C region 2 (CalB), putative [Entamoeba nuttalli P19]EKE39767.1 C2 domain containing protein kinase C region 2 (CalB), putative [Entamoeba nuttalli P19]|eukprot:XP_008857907.1 C2 domain containing protein kinase C region 2 (CalB), putative [Entamoeba nuttalli P19]